MNVPEFRCDARVTAKTGDISVQPRRPLYEKVLLFSDVIILWKSHVFHSIHQLFAIIKNRPCQ